MGTWRELSLDNLRAAKLLAREGHLRSSISRAYCGAYSAVTSKLCATGVSFARGWGNPMHEQLPALVGGTLPLTQQQRRQVKRALRLLRHAREDADYRPAVTVDRALTVHCLRSAVMVMGIMGVDDDGSD